MLNIANHAVARCVHQWIINNEVFIIKCKLFKFAKFRNNFLTVVFDAAGIMRTTMLHLPPPNVSYAAARTRPKRQRNKNKNEDRRNNKTLASNLNLN